MTRIEDHPSYERISNMSQSLFDVFEKKEIPLSEVMSVCFSMALTAAIRMEMKREELMFLFSDLVEKTYTILENGGEE